MPPNTNLFKNNTKIKIITISCYILKIISREELGKKKLGGKSEQMTTSMHRKESTCIQNIEETLYL